MPITNLPFVIAFDTICDGFAPVMVEQDGNRMECAFETEAEAQAEIDSDPEFYEDCFIIPATELGHRTIFLGKGN